MKLTTNFAWPRHHIAPVLAGIAWTMAAALFIASVWLLFDAATVRQALPELRERLAQLDQRTLAENSQPLPPSAEARVLKQRVAAVNARAMARGRPLIAILSRLEGLLPDQAYLASVQRRIREEELLIVAEADNPEPLTAFLLKLEKDPWFSQVLLTRQAPLAIGARKAVQFELRLKEAP